MYHSAINLILKHQNRTKTIIIEQFDSIIQIFYRRPLFGRLEKILLTNKLENQKQIMNKHHLLTPQDIYSV